MEIQNRKEMGKSEFANSKCLQNFQFSIFNFQIISNAEIFKRLRGLKSNITILSRGGDRV